MNDREFVASPPSGGRDPADFALDTISINKANANTLANCLRSFMLGDHDGFSRDNDCSACSPILTGWAGDQRGNIPD